MSKMKKLFAMMMAMVMILAMGMTTFAAATITVNNATGATIEYGQLIVEDRESTIGWKFANKDVATAFKNAYGVDNDDAALQAVIADANSEGGNTEAAAGTIKQSENLAAALEACKGKVTMKADLEGKGMYLVLAEKTGWTYIPMAVFVKTDDEAITLTAKGSKDQVEKTIEDDGQSVSKGDEIEYTVTVQYPYFAPNTENQTFKVTDTLTNATFKAETVSVIGAEGIAFTSNKYAGTNKLELAFTYNPQLAGKTLTITYTVVVGEVSESANLKNKVESTIGTEKSSSEIESDTVKCKVIKKNEDETKLLPGAEFTLYVDESENAATTMKDSVDGMEEVATASTGKDGTVTFDGLDAQKVYYIKETKAPDGYSLNNAVVKLTGAAQTNTDQTDVNKTYTFENFDEITVKDTTLSELPSTGGIGTTIFTVGGCAIMIVAAALFFASRKKNNK